MFSAKLNQTNRVIVNTIYKNNLNFPPKHCVKKYPYKSQYKTNQIKVVRLPQQNQKHSHTCKGRRCQSNIVDRLIKQDIFAVKPVPTIESQHKNTTSQAKHQNQNCPNIPTFSIRINVPK
jgi:hypothetical protein